MMPPLQRRCWSGVLAVGLATTSWAGPMLVASSARARELRPAELQVRRQGNNVSLVVVGVGNRARLEKQKQTSFSWEARVVSPDASGLRAGTQQQVSLPTAGLESVMLLEAGDDYILRVVPDDDTTLVKPQISANGNDLIIRFDGLGQAPPVETTARLDLRIPGRVPQSRFAPPLRPRAVAPPVGDMAVGTMLVANPSFVNVSGPAVTLTLKDAPAKDALMSLARLGGYGFVFVDETSALRSAADGSVDRPVTMAFRGERFDRALNSVLMASGLQGKLDGQTLMVGTTVSSKSFGPQMSKVFRLNQAGARSASNYLGNLGAQITVTNTTTVTSRSSEVAGTSSSSSETSTTNTSERAEAELYGSGVGPLLGLIGTTDTRLNTITLIGDSKLVALAQSYLRQIDLRTRQVAVNVQILSVSLSNDKSIDSTFSARVGTDGYFYSDNGKAEIYLGEYNPRVDSVQLEREVTPMVPRRVWVPGGDGGAGSWQDALDSNGQPIYVPSTDPNAQPNYQPVFDSKGRPVMTLPKVERHAYPLNSYFGVIDAMIKSGSAKTLAQPTLLVQEGEKAKVEQGESVITGVTETERENGSTTYTPERKNAGLNIDIEVSKIDDNGFVTLEVNPEISIAVPTGDVSGGYSIFNIEARNVESGRVRLRDGQSLVITGVITDADRELSTKWPILGDLPLIGQFFRSTASSREKDELVILVTPRIIDDSEGGAFGYGYTPGTPASRSLIQGGF